jgi:hypothetical protein
MEVYVGNLPPKVDVGELGQLFEKVIRPKGWSALLPKARAKRSMSPPHFEIIEVAGKKSVRYGYVELYPESLAQQAIAGLQGATLRGNPVHVREYFNRAYINDQRLIGWRNRRWGRTERRLSERRRSMVVGVPEVERPEIEVPYI